MEKDYGCLSIQSAFLDPLLSPIAIHTCILINQMISFLDSFICTDSMHLSVACLHWKSNTFSCRSVKDDNK